ncbi:MAG: hypothetical protein APR63_02425 [Desulfuromonas sp. SDB]|nr:MAG: hypothetical protein APR63_02425 [Desulfuromonas sp. SDB]
MNDPQFIKEKIDKIYNVLKYESEENKKKAYIEMMTHKELLPEFLKRAKSKDYQDRLCFSLAAAYMKSEKMVGTLLSYLSDENKYVRKEACNALGEIGSDKAIPYLTKTMYGDDSFIVWTRAAVALHKLGDKKGERMLVENYNFDDPEQTEPAVLEAIHELEITPKKKRKPCFVATACMPEQKHKILNLQLWRDLIMIKHETGMIFIDGYNLLAPPVAKLIGKNDLMRKLSKWLLVDPVYFTVRRYFQHLNQGN